jgi:hypothetical protein
MSDEEIPLTKNMKLTKPAKRESTGREMSSVVLSQSTTSAHLSSAQYAYASVFALFAPQSSIIAFYLEDRPTFRVIPIYGEFSTFRLFRKHLPNRQANSILSHL